MSGQMNDLGKLRQAFSELAHIGEGLLEAYAQLRRTIGKELAEE